MGSRLLFASMTVRPFLLIAALLLLAGCGGSDDEQQATSTTTSTVTETTPGPLGGASTDTVVVASAIEETALLTDVRSARQEGFDRVVFEFANGVPGYDVGYVERPIVADGSGDEIAVEGAAVLRVRMEPALDADLTKESAPRTYTGPNRFSPDTAAVVELVGIGGFEAVLTWAVGIDGERPFRVTTLSDPPRLVIDVDSSS
jgi:hypothetical protein